MLWTHWGVSGPVVLDASRVWTVNRGEGRSVRVEASLIPGTEAQEAERWLIRAAERGPRRGVVSVLTERLPRRVAEEAARRAAAKGAGVGVRAARGVGDAQERGIEDGEERGACGGEVEMGRVTRELRRALVGQLTAMELPIAGDRGWNHAEVTAGGVPMAEVDYRTMESRIVGGLHLAGEMLDVDGRIGGFNFQWAWATGRAAGIAARKMLEEYDRDERTEIDRGSGPGRR
jgi:hypothetical protein